MNNEAAIHQVAVQIADQGLTLAKAQQRNDSPGFQRVSFRLTSWSGGRDDPNPDGNTTHIEYIQLNHAQLARAYELAQRLVVLGHITPKEA